jgi:predicted enzyme involved in methoxymalonyl-ACP biosynthesis
MLRQLLEHAAELGVELVEAEHLPTAKNAPCLKFFERISRNRNGNRFTWDPKQLAPAEPHVTIEEAVA